jgi:hypothetical protein
MALLTLQFVRRAVESFASVRKSSLETELAYLRALLLLGKCVRHGHCTLVTVSGLPLRETS